MLILRGLIYYAVAGLFDYYLKRKNVIWAAKKQINLELTMLYYLREINAPDDDIVKLIKKPLTGLGIFIWKEIEYREKCLSDKVKLQSYIKRNWDGVRFPAFSHDKYWFLFPHSIAILLIIADAFFSGQNKIFSTLCLFNFEDITYYICSYINEKRWIPEDIDLMIILKKRWHLYLASAIGMIITITLIYVV